MVKVQFLYDRDLRHERVKHITLPKKGKALLRLIQQEYIRKWNFNSLPQQTGTFLKLTIETLKKVRKYVQS